MKVKIKKEGKIKEFNLIKSWKDVTLSNWTKLIQHKSKSKSSEAIAIITELSNIPEEILKKLELSDVAVLMSRVGKLQSEAENKLIKIIEIEGKRYGFHPDLDSITLGEYADLETMIKNDAEVNLPEIMAILYRPIIEEKNGIYTIESYDGEIKLRAEEMKKMSSQQVQSALVFFYIFGKIFVKTFRLFSIQLLTEMKMQLPQNPLPTNGRGSESYTDSQMQTSQN
jgi:hypothetical protein